MIGDGNTSEITRRVALKRVGMLLGGVVSMPLAAAVLNGCQVPAETGYQPQVLTAAQDRLLTVVVDRIIPATDTPGAVDVGVHRFIDHMLANWYPADERTFFLDSLALIDERAQQSRGRGFLDLPEDRQVELLETVDAEMVEQQNQEDGPAHFFSSIKELTLVGYYTSEVGMTEELHYSFIPGRFDACLPVDEVRGGPARA